jgi:hypothetical protein
MRLNLLRDFHRLTFFLDAYDFLIIVEKERFRASTGHGVNGQRHFSQRVLPAETLSQGYRFTRL